MSDPQEQSSHVDAADPGPVGTKNTETDSDKDLTPADDKRPGFLSIVQSVLGAAVGIQTESKRQQDFQHGKPGDYIFAGIIFVILFVLTLIFIVNKVLSDAGM